MPVLNEEGEITCIVIGIQGTKVYLIVLDKILLFFCQNIEQ